MSLGLIHQGTGLSRDIALFYAVPDVGNVRSVLWPEACALADQNGAYAIVGPGDIEPLGQAVARARHEAGPFRVRGIALIGFGGGCRAVREQIREGARPDVVLALDGITGAPGSMIADEYYLGPWRVVADRARRGECLAVFTHTSQTYMEALPPAQRYPAPITVLREITDFDLPLLAPGDTPVQMREGGLVVQSYPSRSYDGVAHAAQRSVALPHILHELVSPWLDGLELSPVSLPRWHV